MHLLPQTLLKGLRVQSLNRLLLWSVVWKLTTRLMGKLLKLGVVPVIVQVTEVVRVVGVTEVVGVAGIEK